MDPEFPLAECKLAVSITVTEGSNSMHGAARNCAADLFGGNVPRDAVVLHEQTTTYQLIEAPVRKRSVLAMP